MRHVDEDEFEMRHKRSCRIQMRDVVNVNVRDASFGIV